MAACKHPYVMIACIQLTSSDHVVHVLSMPCRRRVGARLVMGAASSTTTGSSSTSTAAVDYYSRLCGKQVFRSSDGAQVDLPSQWGPNEKAVVAFGRSFG